MDRPSCLVVDDSRVVRKLARRMLEGILSQEQEHADELSDWMED